MSTASSDHTPLLTADLPGTGGQRLGPDDFVVEEIAAYPPSGSGTHCFAWIEKRGLTTRAAIDRMAAALSVRPSDIGYAGLKDKQAVTRQWLSLPDVEPDRASALAWDDLRVLEASWHGNKLRTGHLRGNRFTVVLHDVRPDAARAARRVIDRITAAGLPNFYGPQRFGMHGDNAARALQMLRGERPLPRDRQRRRLMISSLQSLLFNDVLGDRLRRDERS